MPPKEETLREGSALVEGEDFYMEGRALVFTELYHLRRGYCCESGCRHCPFGVQGDADAESLERDD
jgi:Family of unknown function (DUF5522)